MLCRGGYDEKHRSGTNRHQRNPASLRDVRVFYGIMLKRASQPQDWLRRSWPGEASKKPGIAARCAGFLWNNAEASFAHPGLASPILFGEGIKETRHRCAMCGFFME
jgi:hypothetical protein